MSVRYRPSHVLAKIIQNECAVAKVQQGYQQAVLCRPLSRANSQVSAQWFCRGKVAVLPCTDSRCSRQPTMTPAASHATAGKTAKQGKLAVQKDYTLCMQFLAACHVCSPGQGCSPPTQSQCMTKQSDYKFWGLQARCNFKYPHRRNDMCMCCKGTWAGA